MTHLQNIMGVFDIRFMFMIMTANYKIVECIAIMQCWTDKFTSFS